MIIKACDIGFVEHEYMAFESVFLGTEKVYHPIFMPLLLYLHSFLFYMTLSVGTFYVVGLSS